MVPEDVNEHLPMMKPVSTAFSPASPCSEIRCGKLTLVRSSSACGCGADLRVVVKVYRTSLEHFAIIYPDKVICKPFGFVNLKHCRVQLLRNNALVMQVVQQSCDGGIVTFRADSPLEAKTWLDCLQSKTRFSSSSPKRAAMDNLTNVSLPILLEEGDEE